MIDRSSDNTGQLPDNKFLGLPESLVPITSGETFVGLNAQVLTAHVPGHVYLHTFTYTTA